MESLRVGTVVGVAQLIDFRDLWLSHGQGLEGSDESTLRLRAELLWEEAEKQLRSEFGIISAEAAAATARVYWQHVAPLVSNCHSIATDTPFVIAPRPEELCSHCAGPMQLRRVRPSRGTCGQLRYLDGNGQRRAIEYELCCRVAGCSTVHTMLELRHKPSVGEQAEGAAVEERRAFREEADLAPVWLWPPGTSLAYSATYLDELLFLNERAQVSMQGRVDSTRMLLARGGVASTVPNVALGTNGGRHGHERLTHSSVSRQLLRRERILEMGSGAR